MAKGLRLSEKWFQRGLWCIAVLFAAFLIGLGNLVVADLPRVEKPVDAEQYMDQTKLLPARALLKQDDAPLADVDESRQRAGLALPIDTADNTANFCMHCGLLVFEHCPRCNTRQTSFSHFCRACGLVKREAPPEERLPPAPLESAGPV